MDVSSIGNHPHWGRFLKEGVTYGRTDGRKNSLHKNGQNCPLISKLLPQRGGVALVKPEGAKVWLGVVRWAVKQLFHSRKCDAKNITFT